MAALEELVAPSLEESAALDEVASSAADKAKESMSASLGACGDFSFLDVATPTAAAPAPAPPMIHQLLQAKLGTGSIAAAPLVAAPRVHAEVAAS